jgi:hypothetical protein
MGRSNQDIGQEEDLKFIVVGKIDRCGSLIKHTVSPSTGAWGYIRGAPTWIVHMEQQSRAYSPPPRAPQPRPPAFAEPALFAYGSAHRRADGYLCPVMHQPRFDVSRHPHRGPHRRRHTPPARRVSMHTTNCAISSPSPHHTCITLCEHLHWHLASHAPATITGTRIHARPRLA